MFKWQKQYLNYCAPQKGAALQGNSEVTNIQSFTERHTGKPGIKSLGKEEKNRQSKLKVK